MVKTVHLRGDRCVTSISFNKKTLEGTVVTYDMYKLNDVEIQTRTFRNIEELVTVTEDIINKLIKYDNAKIITSSEHHNIIHSDLIQDVCHHKL